jgi:RNA polymerase sigma-70 factor (ECF subfamily)
MAEATEPVDPTAALERLYREAAQRFVLAAYALTGDLGEAQECVQEAFVRACAHPARILRTDNPVAWMRTVTVNVARDRMRRKRRFAILHRRLSRPVDVPAASPDRVAILAAIKRLPAEQRETVALYYLADLDVREIAEVVHAPVNTVKSRLLRARQALAAQLGDQEPIPGEVR